MHESRNSMPATQANDDALLAYCRPGFENDCVQELILRAQTAGLQGYGRAQTGQGYARFILTQADPRGIEAAMRSPMPIFARQFLRGFRELEDLPRDDRLTPVIAALTATGQRWLDVWTESPDSDEGRELAALCRGFGNALRADMQRSGLLSAAASHRLHAFLTSGNSVILAEADPQQASPWPGGIPRLRRIAGAPSRSAGKLEEAITVMLDERERDTLLRPGMTAVDLGAAPGGWSWVLARRHLRVSAIDNGPLAEQVLDSGLVSHIRADGFTWQPAQPVDWLVCDMVEQPIRVANLIGTWLSRGLCRQTLFNLKLPMKKRHAEVLRCLDALRITAGRSLELRCRQLYHDREEVTVLVFPQIK